MRLRKILAVLLTAAVVLPIANVQKVEAASERSFSEFSNDFGEFLKNNEAINPNHDNQLSSTEAAAITELEVPAEVCATMLDYDIQFLDCLVNLKTLKINNTREINHLYLERIKSLEYVECYGSTLKTVTLYGCTSLRHLDISSNTSVTKLNITECPNLNYLNIANTGISEIYVANNPMLADAYSNNQHQLSGPWYGYGHGDNTLITNAATIIVTDPYTDGVPLDVEHFRSYNVRVCYSEQVDTNGDGYLRASELNSCKSIQLYNINDTTIVYGIEYLPNLEHLYLSYNIAQIDISHNTKLKELYISSAPSLTRLDTSNNPDLTSLYVYDTGINDLYIQNNPTIAYYILNTNPRVDTDFWGTEYLSYLVNHRVEIEISRNCQIHFDQASPGPVPTTIPLQPEVSQGVLDFCERFYTRTLGRACDVSGRNYWANTIMNGMSGADAAHSFFFSEEYASRNRSSTEFVHDLYRTFMDRYGSYYEGKYWADLIDAGASRESVFWGFVSCPEWQTICADYGINPGQDPNASASPVDAFVERMYTTCLGREVDSAGATYWAELLRSGNTTGTAVAHEFFFSAEFTGAGYSDAEFVNRLYRTFMGRDGDADGINYWVEILNTSFSREDVFNGFATSGEFVQLCRDAGINP